MATAWNRHPPSTSVCFNQRCAALPRFFLGGVGRRGFKGTSCKSLPWENWMMIPNLYHGKMVVSITNFHRILRHSMYGILGGSSQDW